MRKHGGGRRVVRGFALAAGLLVAAGGAGASPPVVPAPREAVLLEGAFAPAAGRPLAASLPAGPTRADFAGGLAGALSGWHPAGIERAGAGAATIAIGLPAEDPALHARAVRLGLQPDPALGEEGYLLAVDADGITAVANGEPGLFHSLQTLRQILRATPPGAPLPAMRIRDWPEFPFRGVMDDISRGPLPSREFLRAQVTRMAELKLNRLTWYIEDVVRVPSHPGFAPAGAIPLEEFRELAGFAAAHHVELVGSFQTLGHFEKILALPEYAPLGATHRMLEPGEPRVMGFLRDVIGDMMPVFPSPWFSLNGDEAFDLAEVAARRGESPAAVYAGHFGPLIRFVESRGRRAMIWGDMMLAHPELLESMPRSVVVGTWNYDGDADFRAQIAPFRDRGYEVVVCPGVVNSNRLSPDHREARANIRRFAAAGREGGATGVLNTVWDDGGMHFFARDWPGVALGAEQSWNPGAGDDADFDDRYGRITGAGGGGPLGRFLEAWQELGKLSPTWDMDNQFRHERVLPQPGEVLALNLEGWEEVRAVVAHARPLLAAAAGDPDTTFWTWTVEETGFHADLRLALARWAADGVRMDELDALIERQARLRDELRRLWFRENRDHFTETALEPDTTRLAALESLRRRLAAADGGTRVLPGVEPVHGQFFTYWLLTGPLVAPAGAPDPLESMGGEARAAPAPGTRFRDASGSIQRWEKHASALGACLDLEHRRGAGVVYAHATLSSRVARTVAARVAHAGELELRVNGEVVAPEPGGTWSLPLRAGRNALLLKLRAPADRRRWQVALDLPGHDVRHRKHRYEIR